MCIYTCTCTCTLYMHIHIPYSAYMYISLVQIFVIFANSMPFAKIFQQQILTLCTIACFYSVFANFFQ